MDFGSIFEEVASCFDTLLGRWPQPPKHLPLRILGLSGNPWPDEIKKAYREKLFAAHPDLRPAFDNPEYQEMAQKGRGDLPDIQELVWARDCALRQAPKPNSETDTVHLPLDGGLDVILERMMRQKQRPGPRVFESEVGTPRICCLCGGELPLPHRITRQWHRGRLRQPRLYCDACIEKQPKENTSWLKRCPACGVWMLSRRHRYCSEECGRSAKAARQRKGRERRRSNRRCAECGRRFTPQRADGKYCSPACRQRAFRKRKIGGRK